VSLTSKIEQLLVDRYLGSGDFNGTPMVQMAADLGLKRAEVLRAVKKMIAEEGAIVLSDVADDNPAILRWPPPTPDVQLAWLGQKPSNLWVYPSSRVLTARAARDAFADRPYSARLAGGEPQLTLVFFDLQVLDHYMRDPRFAVRLYAYGGSLGLRDDYYMDDSFPARDKIAVQTFGIGYRPDGTRVVGIFLRYLHDLTPEHQWIWRAQEVGEQCRIAADYLENALGRWAGKPSLYDALLGEQVVINTMSTAMGRAHLFRETHSRERPPGFHTLLRPTRRAYHDFVGVLDKLLSENIDIEFFGEDVSRIDEHGRTKGSLRVLAEWIASSFRPTDPTVNASEAATKALRRVRRERQEPAHKLTDDAYDLAYFKRQDELLVEVVRAVQALRMILSKHPLTVGVRVPTWLQSGEIRLY
jgi:hypothetical protein